MPLLAVFYEWLVALVPVLVAKAIIALGIGVVSYTGINALFTGIEALVRNSFSGIPSQYIGLIGLCGVDVAVNITLSALAAKLALDVVGGAVNKITLSNKNL